MAKARADELAHSQKVLSQHLISAIRNGEGAQAKALINQGACVNWQYGTLLPLHCACMVGDLVSAKLLLQRGASVDLLDGYGRAALHYAAERTADCVRLMVEFKADPNVRDHNQATPLHWASYKGNDECVALLLEHGADANATDFNADTPLIWAVKKSRAMVVHLLLDYGADPDAANGQGQTALLRALLLHLLGIDVEADREALDLIVRASSPRTCAAVAARFRQQLLADASLAALVPPRWGESVATLRHMCRCRVRALLGCGAGGSGRYLPAAVERLPLPALLRRYVLLLDSE